MDDILASIRRIIAEDPLVTRPVPGSLSDSAPKVSGTPHTHIAAFAPFDDAASAHVSSAVAASPDDDLFEPEPLDADYVSPRPPRELIFRPSANPVDPEPVDHVAARPPVEVWSAISAPTARMPDTVEMPVISQRLDVEPPPLHNDVAHEEIRPETSAVPAPESSPVLDAVDADDATEFAPAVVPPAAIDTAEFVAPMSAATTDLSMNASIEDLLGALAAGLAQQVPSAPHIETVVASTEPVVDEKPPEVQSVESGAPETAVSDEAARRTVADALAAVAAANNDVVLDIGVAPALTDIVAGSDIAEPAAPISVVADVETLPEAMALVGGEATVPAPVTLPDTLPDTAIDLDVMDVTVAQVVETEAVAPPAIAVVVEHEPPVAETISAPVVASAMPAMAAGLVAVGRVAVAAAESAAAEPVVAVAALPQSMPTAPASPPMDDAVSSLLRPLIKDWLDRNMPTLVEKALQDELKSRGGPTHKAD